MKMENSTSSRSLVKFSLNRILKLILSCLLLVLICNVFFKFKIQFSPKKFIKVVATSSYSYKFDNITLPPKDFLIWNENCHILLLETFPQRKCFISNDVTEFPKEEAFVKKIYDTSLNQYRLKIYTDTEKLLRNVSCCYKEILFFEKSQSFGSASCLKFYHDFIVPKHIKYGIIVNCYSSDLITPFFRDAFFFFQHDDLKFKNSNIKAKENVAANLSILLIGIESLSQYTFRQIMPQTFEFMQQSGWFELSGYHTISENTFPNMIALLGGFYVTDAAQYYEDYNNEFLDDYRLLTQKFQKYGYLTAYNGERFYNGTSQLNTKGLREPLTDFYMLPLMDEFEKESEAELNLNNISQSIARRKKVSLIFDTLTEFVLLFKNRPKFGVFLSHFLSHYDDTSDTADASFFDKLMLSYMIKWKRYEFPQNNIFIFFSNHGIHWKKLRKYTYEFYEERLPAMFVWLPPHIREKYPEFVYALTVNQNRLTSPYDIFMTLQHLLSLSIGSNNIFQLSNEIAEGCAGCQSVLRPIPETRSCVDVGISSDWCTCEPFYSLDSKSKFLFHIVNMVVQKINKFLSENYIFLCRKLKLKKINKALIRLKNYDQLNEQKRMNLKLFDPDNAGLSFLVEFVTLPHYMEYTATFVYFRHSNNISLDLNDICSFGLDENLSNCISDAIAKKFCICFED